ncbi:MAG: hypothetical protein CBARDMAM_4444 [uncultured Caballeronia sp.]|nr:MAG: hypothetical protein CBARDMAM_4444 [uncultured Caballeronia sp.]
MTHETTRDAQRNAVMRSFNYDGFGRLVLAVNGQSRVRGASTTRWATCRASTWMYPSMETSKLRVDKGYDSGQCRRDLQRLGITARIAREESKARSGSGVIVGSSSAHTPRFRVSANCAFASSGGSTLTIALFKLAAAVICPRLVDNLSADLLRPDVAMDIPAVGGKLEIE